MQVNSPYSAKESVFIPPTTTSSDMSATDGASGGLLIQGNCSNINQIELNSMHIISVTGSLNPYIRCFRVTGTDTGNDENASLAVFGSQDVAFTAMNLSGSTAVNGIMAYASGISAGGIDLGTTLRNGFLTKHTGRFHFEDSPNLITGWTNANCNVIGNTSNSIYDNQGGLPMGFSKNCASAPNLVFAQRAPVFDLTNGTAYGFNNLAELGIGTISPSEILSVVGNIQLRTSSSSVGTTSKLGFRITTAESTSNMFQIVANRTNSPANADTEAIFSNQKNGTVNPSLRILTNGVIQLYPNVTVATCNSATAGGIYYDTNTFKHFGCNSTNWNSLY